MHSVKKNLIYQMIYRVLTVITPLITTPILSRALGAENIGVFSAVQAYANYFVLFTMLGVENYGARSIAVCQADKKDRQETFWNIYAVQFFASVIAIAVYVLSFVLIDPARKKISLVLGLTLIAAMLNVNWFYFGCENFRATVRRDIFIKIATVIAILYLVKDSNDLIIYALIMSAGTLLSQIVMWYMLPKYIGFERPSWEKVKNHIWPIIRLFIPIIAFSVFHVMDKTMLDILSDEKNLGYYYSADKIINIPLGLITAVSTVMLPRMANILHSSYSDYAKKMLQKTTEVIMFLSSAVAFGIAAIAKEFVPFFFGPGYETCIVLIYAFVPVLFVKAWSEVVRAQYLIPIGKDKWYIIATWAGAFANLVSNYIMISMFDALGAVIGTLIAEAVLLVVQLWGIRKEMPFVRMFVSQGIYMIFGGIMFFVVRIVASNLLVNEALNLLISICCGGICYIILCFGYWIINKNSVFRKVFKICKKK